MRAPLFCLLLLGTTAEADALGDAVDKLRTYAADASREAVAQAYARYRLQPVLRGGDILALAGCRTFSDAERADLRARVEPWVAPRVRRGRQVGSIDITTGCWLAGEGVALVAWNELTPQYRDEHDVLEYALLRVTAQRLTVIEAMHRATQYASGLELSSAGDLDRDGKLDIAYGRRSQRRDGERNETIVKLGAGKTIVVRSVRTLAFFDLGDVRGAFGPGASHYEHGSPLVAAADAWRLDGDKLVRDPALDARLVAAPAAERARREAAVELGSAVRCRNGDPPNEPAIERAVAVLKPPADVVAAARVLLRERARCR